jgi:aspartate/methionine/tyrosine aminotransferase
MTPEDLMAIGRMAEAHNFMLFADEENEHIAFDNKKHVSMTSFPRFRDRVIAGFSFSKAYAMSGFRIGYMVGPAWLVDFAADLTYLAVQGCAALSQKAAIVALSLPVADWLEANALNLQHKRDFAVARLNSMPGVRCSTPSGCYFLFPEIRTLGLSSTEFTERLQTEEKVLVRPGVAYGCCGEGHVRMSFGVSEVDLEEGLDRFERFVKRLAAGSKI